MKLYESEVIADSVSQDGVRITSIATCYPHAVHKDMLRHRNQSRVVESFRARPTELLEDELEAGGAFRPDEFAVRVKGMQQGEAIGTTEQARANSIWDNHIAHCLKTSRRLGILDVAKQQRNFVLQDLCPLVEIITATDWSNYAALRLDLDDEGKPRARPEVYKAAKSIIDALEASEPRQAMDGEWHLPLIDADDYKALETSDEDEAMGAESAGTWAGDWMGLALISAGRCARVSYDKHKDPEPHADSIRRARQLIASGHMSPFEHPCRPITEADIGNITLQPKILVPLDVVAEAMHKATSKSNFIAYVDRTRVFAGNARGWLQYRKTIENEHDYGLLQG